MYSSNLQSRAANAVMRALDSDMFWLAKVRASQHCSKSARCVKIVCVHGELPLNSFSRKALVNADSLDQYSNESDDTYSLLIICDVQTNKSDLRLS